MSSQVFEGISANICFEIVSLHMNPCHITTLRYRVRQVPLPTLGQGQEGWGGGSSHIVNIGVKMAGAYQHPRSVPKYISASQKLQKSLFGQWKILQHPYRLRICMD